MGLGKTAVTLKAIQHLLTETAAYSSCLIVGPKRVIEQTWPDELRKWDDFSALTFSVITGTQAQRLKAAKTLSHIHLISRDNLAWLIESGLFDYDLVILDELSSFKNPSSIRFKRLKSKLHATKKVIGLTGTPVANGMEGLWSQIYCLDSGARLFRTITPFRENFFTKDTWSTFPSFKLRPGAYNAILAQISDICLSMKQEDYLSLPDMIPIEHALPVPAPLRTQYDQFKRDQVLQLTDTPETLTAMTAGALANKLLQFCGGRVYNEDHVPVTLHQMKLDALQDLIEQANGQPVLIYYSFLHERDAILKLYPTAKLITDPGVIDDWNKGQIPILLAHPASAGHGLNLQEGGHIIIWYNLTYDLELYQQANKRLHRMGQQHPVLIHHITCKGLLDSTILNHVLKEKSSLQSALMTDLRR
jgi:SNF2 family DNA or RNA helicase